MSELQHTEARRLLQILAAAVPDQILTYTTAAEALGRDPKTNSRMVAQCCDLLDAAAAMAGVPLLALFWVREKSGKINHKAWKDHGPEVRNAVIALSQRHTFTDADFAAIKEALNVLKGRGNHKAWDWIREQKADEDFWKLVSLQSNAIFEDDAIEDLGSDRPESVPTLGKRYLRDPKVRAAVIERAQGKCEFCGRLGFKCADGTRYLECHHIIALANEGPDRMNNVIALCPGDHREAHFGERRTGLEKEMIRIVAEKA
ncbi:MAG TPA: HNH endonuclease signature motif containing protein [Pseudolabrys sp.]